MLYSFSNYLESIEGQFGIQFFQSLHKYLLMRIKNMYNILWKVIKISNLEDISSTVGNHRNPQKEEQNANSCCHSLYIRTVSSDPVFYFTDPVSTSLCPRPANVQKKS